MVHVQTDEILAQKCQRAAFHYLKIRLRSSAELRQKLEQKKFHPKIIDQTIKRLFELDFLNDQLFTRQWIQYRLQMPYGPKRIHYELLQKGIALELLERELIRALHSFKEEEVVLKLAKKRALKYTGAEPETIKRRVYGYLTRRGFQSFYILNALKQL